MIIENSIRTGEFTYMPTCEEVIFRNDRKSGLPIGGNGPISLENRIISGEVS